MLQISNISRDIVRDSEKIGRCYIPLEYMDDKENEERILCKEKNPRALGNKKLKEYSAKLMLLVNRYRSESQNAVRYLPHETRGPILLSVDIYIRYNSVIKSSSIFPTKAKLSKWDVIFFDIFSLYIKSIFLHVKDKFSKNTFK